MAISILLSIAATLWLYSIYTSLGFLVCHALKLSFKSSLLSILISFTIGFGLVGNIVMLLAFLQWSTPRILIALLIVLTIISISQVKESFFHTIKLTRAFLTHLKNSSKWIALPMIIVIGGYGARGLLPPTGFDGIMYHLSTAKLYLEHGGFFDIYFNGQSDFPMLTEIHFMLGLALGNDIICKSLSFMLGVFSLGAIAHLYNQLSTGKGTLLCCLIFCTTTPIIANMSNCDVDIPQALWTILSLCVLDCYFNNKRTSLLVVSGFFAGMALQTKIFGVFVIPLLIIRVVLEDNKSINLLAKTKVLLFLMPVPLLMGLPWYIKSYIYNGTVLSITKYSSNPGMPTPMGIECINQFSYWIYNSLVRMISAPWTFSLFPSQHRGNTLGPLLLAVLPFLFFLKKPPKIIIFLVLMSVYLLQVLVMEMLFIQVGSSIRYSLVLLFWGIPLVVWTIEHLNQHKKTQRMLYVFVFISVFLGTILFIKRYHKEWIAHITFQSRDSYYHAILPEYPVIAKINQLDDDKVVIPIYNYSDYLLSKPYITAHRRYASRKDILEDFKSKNIRYIFANNKLDIKDNRGVFPEIPEKQCLFTKNEYYLYLIPDSLFFEVCQ